MLRSAIEENNAARALSEANLEEARDLCFQEVLTRLEVAGLTWGDLVEWICTPGTGRGDIRYRGLFERGAQVERILDLWVSKNSRTGRDTVHKWALQYVGQVVSKEGHQATKSGTLMSCRMALTESFVLNFNFSSMHRALSDLCPSMADLMHAFSTTQRQRHRAKQISESAQEEERVGQALSNLLATRSQNNSYVRHILGLYLYTSGAQRQVLSVLSALGICSGYTTIAGSGSESEPTPEVSTGQRLEERRDRDAIEQEPNNASQTPTTGLKHSLYRGVGLLQRLCAACRLTSRTCAQTKLCGHVYDNINMMFKIAEQILGRKDSQENGTCATIFPLLDARAEDMQTADMLASFDAAPPLSLKDILHTSIEAIQFEDSLEHAALRDLVYTSDLFARFRPAVAASLPHTDHQIPLHRTEIHPLPTMNIDESSIVGNAQVIDTMFQELGFDVGTTKFSGIVRPIFGDQLSIARLRTLFANRAGHESIARSYSNLIFGPGFFHHQMALTHGIIETHWGDPHAGTRNPGSLSFLNTVLDRKPIVLTSLPPYRTCRDLIFVSLSACLLHCLERVCGWDSFSDYIAEVSFNDFCAHVKKIMKTYVNAAECPSSTTKTPQVTEGDIIYENICLFLRDALVLREFTDAIKGGYSGRIIRTLKVLALMYRGSGRTKYAHELLHLIHNLTHVWPKPLRDIVIKNWLVNPSGKPNSWVPVDLLQEHMNFWVKVIFKAQGSNASWDWLGMISPCIGVLRKLALEVNGALGVRLGSKHHTPNVERDLMAICNSLQEHNVFGIERGRVINPIDVMNGLVPNVINIGLNQLAGPLDEYNDVFRKLQRRRRMTPLIELAAPAGDVESQTHRTSDVRFVLWLVIYYGSIPSADLVTLLAAWYYQQPSCYCGRLFRCIPPGGRSCQRHGQ
ncbi:hypothetical protein C8Q73DRAFT_642360 [Cubamyces lactineus]|nr:hypothetical protein C8Q73DRAFT_642360 [Cubamyces lactineus]